MEIGPAHHIRPPKRGDGATRGGLHAAARCRFVVRAARTLFWGDRKARCELRRSSRRPRRWLRRWARVAKPWRSPDAGESPRRRHVGPESDAVTASLGATNERDGAGLRPCSRRGCMWGSGACTGAVSRRADVGPRSMPITNIRRQASARPMSSRYSCLQSTTSLYWRCESGWCAHCCRAGSQHLHRAVSSFFDQAL